MDKLVWHFYDSKTESILCGVRESEMVLARPWWVSVTCKRCLKMKSRVISERKVTP